MPNITEQKIIDNQAVGILGNLLDKRYLEHLPINGNYPGVDGLLQFINKNKAYTSKYLLYQAKGKIKLKKYSFPCKVSDLQHWANSSPPVIFILIDNDKQTACWQQIDRRYLRSLQIKENQKYKTIVLDSDKCISSDSDYLNEWYTIALGEDNFKTDEWNAVVNNIEEKIHTFIGIFYLLAPIQDGDIQSVDKIKEKLSIGNREFTVLLYESLKRGLIKSVGRILLVSDEKSGLAEVVEHISKLSKKEVKSIISMAKDEKQKSVILRKVAEIKNENSDEVLDDMAEEFLKDIKKNL